MTNTPPGKSLGRGMLTIGWILVLGILAMIFARWERHQINPNQEFFANETGAVREIVLEANRYHHYLASGTINGKQVTFLLDTGATEVVVPSELAEQLGLRAGPRGYAQTANGTIEVRATVIDELAIGPIRFTDVRASINPGMSGDDEVLLGMSALRQVELLQKDNQLTLRQNLR
ncbi:TIGR02281 family clan AA aspartic protease [Aurantivibrio infirmus]